MKVSQSVKILMDFQKINSRDKNSQKLQPVPKQIYLPVR